MDLTTALVGAMEFDYSYSTSGPGGIAGALGAYLISALLFFFLFGKAGEPRWAAFVPLYNAYVHTRIAGYNPWLFLLYLIPIVNVVFAIMVAIRLAKAFGHGAAFGFFLMFLLAIIGYLIVIVGSDTYDRSRITA